jgi:cobalt-zinc-cadmium resistance protein CzcA
VGFIALFGIAVLNGIVLIEHLKELQHSEGMRMRELIIQGTKDRLRPVLLTAGAAAMGFLPMAISTGAGAEVQRPLATVVIGGLFTSTMLTLIALPLMFEIFYNVVGVKFRPLRFIRSRNGLMLLFLLPAFVATGQKKIITLDEAVRIALQHNKEVQGYTLRADQQKALIPTAFDLEKTSFYYGSDQNNIAENNHPLKVWGVTQNFHFPSLYHAQKVAQKMEYSLARAELEIQSENLIKSVTQQYIDLQIINEKQTIFRSIDSLYQRVLNGASLKKNKGDIPPLDLLTLQAKHQEIVNRANEALSNYENAYARLQTLMGIDSSFELMQEVQYVSPAYRTLESTPLFLYLQSQEALGNANISVEKRKLLPDFSIQYFLGTNHYDNAALYHGFEAGIAVPLYFSAQKSRIKASRIALEAMASFSGYELALLKLKQKELMNRKARAESLLEYYQSDGNQLYNEMMRAADLSLQNGEIDFFRFASIAETALEIKLRYFDTLADYTAATLELNYLSK